MDINLEEVINSKNPMKVLEVIQRLSTLGGDMNPDALMNLTRQLNKLNGDKQPEESKGFIPPNLPPKEKVVRYVELLWGDEDKVLMGEPSSFTMPYYNLMSNFNCTDLEFFAAFCGLVKLSNEGYYSSVEREMLKQPESFDNIAKWVYNPPKIVKGTLNTLLDKEHTKNPQKGKDYIEILQKGPFNLLFWLFEEDSSLLIPAHFAKSSSLANFVTRLVDLIGRTEEEYVFLKNVSMKVLAKIGRHNNGAKEMRKHKTSLMSRLENVDDDNAKAIISILDGSTQPLDEREVLRESGCAKCGSHTNLKNCSRCFSRQYCSVGCQKVSP